MAELSRFLVGVVCRSVVRVVKSAKSDSADGATSDRKRKCQTEANMSAPMVKVRKTPI